MMLDADVTETAKRIRAYFSAELVRLTGTPGLGLYHYTTVDRLLLILSSKVMRAYCVDYLNDYAELRYAASIMRAHLDRARAVEPIPEAEQLFNAVRSRMRGPLTTTDVFVLSFSTDGDEEGTWRLYADRGRGVSFSMPIAETLNWASASKGYTVQVVYGDDTLNEFCARALSYLREMFLADLRSGKPIDAGIYADLFLGDAKWFAPVFKPQVWSDEKEWRLVFFKQDEHLRDPDGRHFIEIAAPPITDVCLGPASALANHDFQSQLIRAGFTRGFYRSKHRQSVAA